MASHDPARGKGYGWRLRLGMLLPSSNPVAEPEVNRMLPSGVSLHTTRLKLAGSSPEQLLGMTAKVEEASELLVDAGVDRLVFNCTAVSTYDPAQGESLRQRIESVAQRPATSTSDAIVAGLRALKARRIVLVTPYIEEVNVREVAFLAHHGVEVLSQTGRGLLEGKAMASVEPGEWYRAAIDQRDPQADAYFLSCTAIRVAEIIAPLERDLGAPVITSNQAMTWHCLREAGLPDDQAGFGALFSLGLP